MRILVAAALALALHAVPPADAATYKGRSVDERRYTGNVFNELAGKIQNVQIRFNGDMAFVGSSGQLVLQLRDETITDPGEIEAYDHKRGILWIIEVLDLESGKP
jgi:hypothetical protein